jgi:hypothetical protein
MDELDRLRPGMAVWDIGHHRVGTVTSVDEDSFKLSLADDGTLSVRSDAIFWVGSTFATLVCHEDRLGAYQA